MSLPPSDVKIVRFSEQSSAKDFEIAIPENEVHRIYNIFERREYSLPVNTNIGDDLTVVDVGANVGVFALYSQLFGRNVDVFCFEPNPQVFPLLERNTNGNPNIKIFNNALGAFNGTLTLHQHPLNTGQASTTIDFDGAEKVEVPVRNSGEMIQQELGIKKIDVLKVDTEGAEVSILEGLRNLLPNTKIVMAEYHTESDRKKIEEMLTDFLLYSAEVQELRGVGTVKYANLKFLGETG